MQGASRSRSPPSSVDRAAFGRADRAPVGASATALRRGPGRPTRAQSGRGPRPGRTASPSGGGSPRSPTRGLRFQPAAPRSPAAFAAGTAVRRAPTGQGAQSGGTRGPPAPEAGELGAAGGAGRGQVPRTRAGRGGAAAFRGGCAGPRVFARTLQAPGRAPGQRGSGGSLETLRGGPAAAVVAVGRALR